MTGFNGIIHTQLNISRPNPTSFLGGMVAKRKQHREPVIRALLALPRETSVEASAFLVAGFVYLPSILNRKQQFMYTRKPVTRLTGAEPFTNTSGKQLTLLDFWRYGLSNLNSNVTRGALAEFIVENALKDTDDIELRNPWGDWDVEYKGKKIEVKCSSYLQDWDQGELSRPVFTGLKAKELYYNDIVGKKSEKDADYKADIYVLCVLHHKETETLDVLDLDQWSFYVLSKEEIKEVSGDSSTLSLAKLNKSDIPISNFSKLRERIMGI